MQQVEGISTSDSSIISSCIGIRRQAWVGGKCSSWAKMVRMMMSYDVVDAHGDSASLTLFEQRM